MSQELCPEDERTQNAKKLVDLIIDGTSTNKENFRLFFSYARELTGNYHDAEDVMGETLRRISKAALRFKYRINGNGVGDIIPWVYTIIRNVLKNQRRDRQRSWSTTKVINNDFLDNQTVSREKSPVQQTIEREEESRKREIYGDLPEEQWKILEDFYVSGLSYNEIMAKLRISHNDVGYRLYKARKALRERLESSN